MHDVCPAEPYDGARMGSLGDASYMYHRQFNFPKSFDESRDNLKAADHDRLKSWDYNFTRSCFKRHTGTGDMGLGEWVRRRTTTDEQVMEFLKEVMKAERSVVWTGYRVTGCVNRGNGYPVWTLELFAKHPKSKTKVYTGDKAPNILRGPRYANR